MTGDQTPFEEDTASASERFRLLAKTTHDIFWDWNLETNQVWRNERFKTVFGPPGDEGSWSADDWFRLIHPDDRDRISRHLQDVIARGSEWSEEYRLQRPDGSYAYVYDRGYTIQQQGKTVRMVGSLLDISDRVRLQQARQESEEDWRIALESAEMGTWRVDLTTGLVRWDERCRQFFGYTTAVRVAYRDLLEQVHPADRERVETAVRNAFQPASAGRFAGECRVTGADDGKMRWLRCRGKVYFNETGEPARFAGTLLDITEERRREEALRNVENRFQTAFDNASVGIAISDLRGTFIQVNRTFARMTGYRPDELYNATYAQVIHPDDLPRYQAKLESLLDRQLTSVVAQKRCLRKDGGVIWLSIQATMTYDEAGRPESVFSIIHDITPEIVLRENQQKMLTMVENSLSFMAIADMEGRVSYLNRAGRELIGLDENESIIGKTVAHFYAPEQYQQLMEVAIPTLLSRGSWSGRVTLRHFRTGESIPCHANGIRIDDPETGKPIGRGFTMRDLRPELAAQEAQQKLLTLVDNSIELMSILELDGRNSYLNKAGMQMLGFDSEQEVLDTPISRLHAPEHFSLVQEQVLPSVMNNGRWSGKMMVRNLKTEEAFPVFNNTVRIDDPDSGQPIAVGAVMRDMRPELATQQALLESETRFRNMIMQAPVAISLLRGEQFVVEAANEYILNFWGKGPEIIGRPLVEALPEIQGQGFTDLLTGVYTTGNAYYGYETLARLARKGQLQDCYFNFVYAPVRESDGSINGIMVVATEVTPQVKAKKELEESEKRFRNLILDAPVATAVYAGRDMVIQLANEAMLKLWGKDASVIGKKLRDALPELEGQPFHQLLDEVYTTGVVYQGREDRADLIVDGVLQSFYFNFTYKPLRDADGKVYAILNMALDITYQVTAKQQLREAEESLREAVDLAELATWTLDPQTGDMVCSDRVRDWLGLAGPITAEVILDRIHEKDRAEFDRITQAALQPGSDGALDLEYTVVNQQTGQEHILHTQARVLYDEQGAPYLLRGTSQEITAQRMTEQELEKQVQLRTEELKKSNVQLQQSNQELERYAYVASHDLQEPLRKIQIYSGILSEQFQEEISTEGRRFLAKIEESANRMSVLIKNILDFSRTNHQAQFEPTVDLNEVVASVLKDLELLLTQKHAQVHLQGLCVIEAIPLQMRQLFYNLIGNALKFSRDSVPPVITITCRSLSEEETRTYEKLNHRLPHCEITVADNGIGFNPAFSDRIFGLFQRLHPRQQYEGTGIGLALCQRIVINHQGELRVEAEEGKGATFSIVLPIRR